MKVIVIGAGLAGLATATWLRQHGIDVLIVEASARPGGRALTVSRPDSDDIVDVGSQYFHSNYKRALSLIKSQGLSKDVHKIKGYTRFFDPRVSGNTFRVSHRLPYVRAGSLFANLRQILMGGYRMVRHFIDPYAVQKNSKIDKVLVRDAVTDPLEWEFNARTLLAAGALVEVDQVPVSYLQLVRLMRIILMTDYLCLNGGIGSLHASLSEKLDIRYNSPAVAITTDEAGVTGVELSDGQKLSGDHVVVATTPGAAANLLPMSWSDQKSFLSEVSQPPALVVTLFLDRPLEKGVWSYVFRPNPKRLVSFCVDTAQKNPAMAPSGNAALQAWICFPRSADVMALSDADIVEAVVQDLAPDFVDLATQVAHSHVHRVDHAIPQFPPGQIAKSAAFLAAADKQAGIEFCGDYLSGGYMECALWSAERAVSNIMGSSPKR